MFQFDPAERLPTAAELPDSDGKPVDNELHIDVPGLLSASLALAWATRDDWFFGTNMGLYYAPDADAIVPDGFLSLQVPRRRGENGRFSYVLWEEGAIPTLVLEVVSRTYRGEYDSKLNLYQDIGIPFYLVFNPLLRRKRGPFECYRLIDGAYQRQLSEPVWMPDAELAIGRGEGTYKDWRRDWLYWFDQNGERLAAPEEQVTQERQRADQERQRADLQQQRADQEGQRADQERQRADQERQRAAALEQRLRELGVDPE